MTATTSLGTASCTTKSSIFDLEAGRSSHGPQSERAAAAEQK
ncbi:MAG TPA: hypothetical protein VND96_06065 [Candidatus Micrarchaeaceae archaeon]|nr:hypothetical protein [Candidatus Micrarchaeaceae archaeon]